MTQDDYQAELARIRQHNAQETNRNESAVLDLLHIVLNEQREIDHKLTQHIIDETAEFQKILGAAQAVAFPMGDPVGHRRHHEAVIKAAEDRAKFWETLRGELAKWGMLGFLGFAIVALWRSFLQGPK